VLAIAAIDFISRGVHAALYSRLMLSGISCRRKRRRASGVTWSAGAVKIDTLGSNQISPG
jgi:hypothetical protein